MDITPQVKQGIPFIRGYGGGCFLIEQARYEHSILITPHAVFPWEGDIGKLAADEQEEIQKLLELTLRQLSKDIEILLVGTGRRHSFVPPAFIRSIREKYGVALEIMDTGAACRTFNILIAEERLVAAALAVI